MSAALMFLIKHEVITLTYRMFNRRKDLVREPRYTQGLGDGGEDGGGGVELAVGIDGAGEALGEPVEGDVG